MKKLKISQQWIDKLINLVDITGEGYNERSNEIDLVNYQLCNISGFRYNLHNIVDIDNEAVDKEIIHNEISNNNFTRLILKGILEVVED